MSTTRSEFSLNRAAPMRGPSRRGQDTMDIYQDARKGRNTGGYWLMLVSPPLHSTGINISFAIQKQGTKLGPGKARMNTRPIAGARIAVISVLCILVSALYFLVPLSGRGKDLAFSTDSAIGAVGVQVETLTLPGRIRHYVRQLEYSDKVADDFIRMVSGWKNEKRKPALRAWQQALDEANQQYAKGKMTEAQLAAVEKVVIEDLVHTISQEITGNTDAFELTSVISRKQAQCVSYSMLFYIVGNSLGLVVGGIEVDKTDLKARDPSTFAVVHDAYKDHVATLVDLSDKTAMIADAALHTASKPFQFEETYAKVGNFWELRNVNSPLVHGRIRHCILLSALHDRRGVTAGNLGQHTQAISDLTKAIALDVNNAAAYNNRGTEYEQLGQYDHAFADFTKAIALDVKEFSAYYNRGTLYWRVTGS
jgi:tetratricopeptide (TPR) repeat protein